MVAFSSRGTQLPSWGSTERIASNSPSGPISNSSSRQLNVDAIPDMTCRPTYRAEPRVPRSR